MRMNPVSYLVGSNVTLKKNVQSRAVQKFLIVFCQTKKSSLRNSLYELHTRTYLHIYVSTYVGEVHQRSLEYPRKLQRASLESVEPRRAHIVERERLKENERKEEVEGEGEVEVEEEEEEEEEEENLKEMRSSRVGKEIFSWDIVSLGRNFPLAYLTQWYNVENDQNHNGRIRFIIKLLDRGFWYCQAVDCLANKRSRRAGGVFPHGCIPFVERRNVCNCGDFQSINKSNAMEK
ncbi:hypothetical protein V1477_000987 [Vespula maculifrons]|uniref:Uncharacterized protein n=1 Tax=Vespula maculifrons TaxID=7453 RepID=A0ABD2D1T2_VESMC